MAENGTRVMFGGRGGRVECREVRGRGVVMKTPLHHCGSAHDLGRLWGACDGIL